MRDHFDKLNRFVAIIQMHQDARTPKEKKKAETMMAEYLTEAANDKIASEVLDS